MRPWDGIEEYDFPVVTVCGSTRFKDQIMDVRARLSLAGFVVLGSEVWVHSDPQYQALHDSFAKTGLDVLHLAKIDLSEYIVVANFEGYVGESTRKEILHARERRIPVVWVEGIPGFGDRRIRLNDSPDPDAIDITLDYFFQKKIEIDVQRAHTRG